MPDARILVGKITAAHGVRGEVKVKSFTSTPSDICSYSPLFGSDGREYRLKLKSRGTGDTIIAAIEGVSDRDAAQALRGTKLHAERAKVARRGEVLLSDLPGLRVIDAAGAGIGRIRDILNYGAGDILEIALEGRGTALILLSPDGVLEMNVEKGYVKIDTGHLMQG